MRSPWVTTVEAQVAEQRRVSALVGRRILGGRYFELDYGSGRPAWDGPDFHALDYGLELVVDDGTTWSFIWDQAGPNEGLAAEPSSFVETCLSADANYKSWPLSGVPEWQPYLGAGPIRSVQSEWVHDHGDICPVTWLLTLDDERALCLTLGTRETDGSFRSSHDDVAVFFDLQTARASGVGHDPVP